MKSFKPFPKFFKKAAAAALAAITSAGFALPAGAADANADSSVDSGYINYASALQYSLYIFDANMCGGDVDEKCALDWRGNCHTYDIYEYNGKQIDLSGGYHDAGDHVKFGLPAAYTMATLELAYNEFGSAFKKTKQDAHLKVILDRFADYFKKCAVYGDDGKIETFCYQVGTGGGDYDHGYWGPPEDQPKEYNIGERQAYFTSDDNPCADIVAGTAAALAAHYVNYGDKASLQVAKDLFVYMREHEKVVSEVPQYVRWQDAHSPNDPWDYISLAALWLNKATGTEDDSDMINPLGLGKRLTDWPCNWDGVWPMVNVLKGDWQAVANNNCKNNFGSRFRFIQKWGSARLNANMQFIGLIHDNNNDTTKFTEWARGQMDYLFGKNDQNQAYIIGYNYRDDVKYPLYPHHRASDGGDESPGGWNEETNEPIIARKQAHVLIGALVGGPETSLGDYHDSLNNYVGNEVAIDYSAGFIGSLAALYLQYGQGDEIISPPSLMGEGVKDMYQDTGRGSVVPIVIVCAAVAAAAVCTVYFLKKKKVK